MHLYNIKMKDGTEYKRVLLTDERGWVGNLFLSVVRDDPRICFVTFKNSGSELHKLSLLEIEHAICENERVGVGKIMDVDELPAWLELHRTYLAHRSEIDALPEGQKAQATFAMMKRKS